MSGKFYDRFILDRTPAENAKFNPYYPIIESGLDDPVIVNGREFINLASNNYLGLATDKRVKKAVVNAVEKYGASLCGTPIATGYVDLYSHIEQRMANYLELEDSILLPSCYQANNGIFSALATKDDVILVDHYAHSSLVEGIRAAGCKVRPFLHNDTGSLEKILSRCTDYKTIFVVTESVFSTEGSIAPFKEIVDICKKFNAIPVIDDSHGIGVIGKNGSGILSHFDIENFEGIYLTSLGKAFANAGGVIAGKKSLIDYLRYYCPHLIYSTALTPATLAGINEVLNIVEQEFTTLSGKMMRYRNIIRNGAKSGGFHLAEGGAPITSIIAGNTHETFLLAKKLYENGILSTPFVYPSVPKNEGKIRLIAGANLLEESVIKAAKTIQEIGETR